MQTDKDDLPAVTLRNPTTYREACEFVSQIENRMMALDARERFAKKSLERARLRGAPSQAELAEQLAWIEKQYEQALDQLIDAREIHNELGPRRLAKFEHEREPEERLFWMRRFHTSLGIGNAAAFAAVTSQVIKPEMATATAAKTLAAAALWPMMCFAAGLVAAGLLPMVLALGARRAWPLALASSVLFIAGLILAVDGVMGVAGLVWPWEVGG